MLKKTMQDIVPRTRKLLCLLRNYTEHAKEMNATTLEDPIYFIKPSSSILLHKRVEPLATIEIPERGNVHHELELAVIIGKKGKNISEENAMSYVAGYCLALDMTERNRQGDAKTKGQPWSIAKGFDTFAPLGDEFFDTTQIKDPHNIELYLKVNGVEKQRDSTKNMIHSIPKAISFISKIMTLEEADMILMGTPSGVGPVKPGDIITCGITNISKEYKFAVANRSLESKL